MKNRAKCRKCGDIIESFHRYDYVYCKCKEIGISGGLDEYHVAANDFNNFLRIDDEGKEVAVMVQNDADEIQISTVNKTFSKKELIRMLDETRKKIDQLPMEALCLPITHADYATLLMLLVTIFQCEEESA